MFQESRSSKIELIRDVFENMDLDYDVDVKVYSYPVDLHYRSKESPSKQENISTYNYHVYLKINNIDDKIGPYLMKLIEKCEKWARVKLTLWGYVPLDTPGIYSGDISQLPHHIHSLYVIKQTGGNFELRFLEIPAKFGSNL